MRFGPAQLFTSGRRLREKTLDIDQLDDEQQQQLDAEQCAVLVPSNATPPGSEGSAPGGATPESQPHNACIVSCQPAVAHEVRGIAQVLGHNVAAVGESSRYLYNDWQVLFGATLERCAATCDDWLVICGPGGKTDLFRSQQMELESVAYFFQHPFNRSLTYITIDEYREALTMYVRALEANIASTTQRLADLRVTAAFAANSTLSLGNVEDHFTPCFVTIVGCKYFSSFNGHYVLMPRQHHGRNFYIRETGDSFGRRPCIYFWDDRDGQEQCGWWLGFERSNGRVFAAHNRNVISKHPPRNNWAVRNWTGWVLEPSLQVLPNDLEDVGGVRVTNM